LDATLDGVGVKVAVEVRELPTGVVAVAAGAGAKAVGAAAGGVPGAGGGCASSTGGIFKVIPTRKRVVSLNAFALIISGYLLPLPYTFCAMSQGLSPLCTMYVLCPVGWLGVRGAAAALGVSPGKVGMKIGTGKTYGGLGGSSVGVGEAPACAPGAASTFDARAKYIAATTAMMKRMAVAHLLIGSPW
ncbi:MAG TPA: hypothetical protein VF478_13220, partial [Anaerolineae bacterium]